MEYWNADYYEQYTMEEMDEGFLAPGYFENWQNHDAIGADSTLRGMPRIVKDIDVGTPENVTSGFTDDLLNDFPDSQYIELVLIDFPAQADAARFNLNTSSIQFTSDYPGFGGGATDTLTFASSLTTLTAGGDLVARWDRASLVNVDLTNVTGVRFHLEAAGAGTATFKAAALRMRPQTG